MIHHTINNNNTFDCSKKNFDPGALESLRPVVDKALKEGKAHLPRPLNNFFIKITKEKGIALFDFYDRTGKILSANIIAWTSEGAKAGWPLFRKTFLTFQAKIPNFKVLTFPEDPGKLPYLSTLIFPGSETQSEWIADAEQCFAKVIMRDI